MGMVSYKTKHEMVFISTTIHTSNGKFKCWVYGGADFEWIQDTFEVDVPTKEEWLKVFTSSCNSRSHRGEQETYTRLKTQAPGQYRALVVCGKPCR
jgi:hypothetical protein